MYSIETLSLTKKYKDVTAVDGLDLKVRSGEIFSLLGVNGAGKTTAIRMLSCLTEPTSGTATVGGADLLRESERIKRMIGISPQETAVAPGLSTRETLELIASARKRRKKRYVSCQKPLDLTLCSAKEPVSSRAAGREDSA